MDSIRSMEDMPLEAVSASVSLDGVMVALRAGEDGRDEACWREAACGTVLAAMTRDRRTAQDPLLRPRAGERQAHG